jgi:hypothetical protein
VEGEFFGALLKVQRALIVAFEVVDEREPVEESDLQSGSLRGVLDRGQFPEAGRVDVPGPGQPCRRMKKRSSASGAPMT